MESNVRKTCTLLTTALAALTIGLLPISDAFARGGGGFSGFHSGGGSGFGGYHGGGGYDGGIRSAPIRTAPIETRPIETRPIETRPIETRPIETRPIETRPIGSQPSRPPESRPSQPMPDKPGKPDSGKPEQGKPSKPAPTAPVKPRPPAQPPKPVPVQGEKEMGSAPPKPGADKLHSDRSWTWHGHRHFWWGLTWNYFGPWYHGPEWVPGEYAYPYPYIYPDYYPDEQLYPAPCDVWSIITWFNGTQVTAYWDPYLGGYYYFDPAWGYTLVGGDADVCNLPDAQ
jgi:hypothetical protein